MYVLFFYLLSYHQIFFCIFFFFMIFSAIKMSAKIWNIWSFDTNNLILTISKTLVSRYIIIICVWFWIKNRFIKRIISKYTHTNT